MECDLHGYELTDAIIEVFHALEECAVTEDQYLTLVHGYTRGSVLRNYFRSKRFLQVAAREGHRLQSIKTPNPGQTRFLLKGL